MLSAVWRASFAPFAIAFALIYGLLIDGFCWAQASEDTVKRGRLVAAVTLSTAIVASQVIM